MLRPDLNKIDSPSNSLGTNIVPQNTADAQGFDNSSVANIDEFEKQQAVETVKRRYNNSRQMSLVDFERFARYYRLFRNRQTKRNYMGLANLFVPEPYRIIRKKTAKLSNAIRYIECDPQTQRDIQPAKVGTVLLNYLRRVMNWKMLERTAIQESRIVGLSWVKATWNLAKETPEQPYLGFDLSFHPADRVLIDNQANMSDVFNGDLKWLVHEYQVDFNSLKKNPNYDPKSIELLEHRGSVRISENNLSISRVVYPYRSKLPIDNKIKNVVIKEYWGKYQMRTGEEFDALIVLADDSILLQFVQNPYLGILKNPIPFVPFVGNLVGQELYPVGDIEPAETLFNELNDTRNQRMDTVTLNVDPMKVITKAANIDEKELVAKRGWIVHSNLPGQQAIQVIPPDMQGVKAATEEEQVIRGDIQQVTGVIDFAQNTAVQAGVNIDTARGAIIAQNEADVQTEDELTILKQSLQMLYRIVLAYAQTFLDRQFTVRVVQDGVEQFFTIDKNSIAGQMDLDVEMKTLQDRTTEQQMKLMLFNQAKTVPGANIGKFFTDLLESFTDGNVNVAEYYQAPQPAPPAPPKVSISLKGELSGMQSAEVYKTIPGVDKDYGDPLLVAEGRQMIRGEHPEKLNTQAKKMEILKNQNDILNQQNSSQQATG